MSFVPTDGTAPLPLLVHGEPEKVDEARASEIIAQEDLEIRVDLGLGTGSAKYWTCDFSYVSFLFYPDTTGILSLTASRRNTCKSTGTTGPKWVSRMYGGHRCTIELSGVVHGVPFTEFLRHIALLIELPNLIFVALAC